MSQRCPQGSLKVVPAFIGDASRVVQQSSECLLSDHCRSGTGCRVRGWWGQGSNLDTGFSGLLAVKMRLVQGKWSLRQSFNLGGGLPPGRVRQCWWRLDWLINKNKGQLFIGLLVWAGVFLVIMSVLILLCGSLLLKGARRWCPAWGGAQPQFLSWSNCSFLAGVIWSWDDLFAGLCCSWNSRWRQV